MAPPNHFALLLAFALIASPAARGQFSFTDRTDLLSNTGFGVDRCSSGVAIGVVDMDGDGKDDIVRLHDNDLLAIETQAAPDAAFGHRVIGSVGIDPWALCVADIDGNGFNDLILAPLGGGIRLYSANSGGTNFSVSRLPLSDIDCQGTIFADLNNDGHIDLFSCHDSADNAKWENFGGGEFVRDDALIDTDLGLDSEGNYAALWSDIDQDGAPDLYLSKCSQFSDDPTSPTRINRLFTQGPGGFSDTAPAVGLADGAQSWCADFADIDNDGDLDCFILNHPEEDSPGPSRLMENVGGTFVDITAASGLADHLALYGIHAVFRDFDNDGFVDLLVSSSDLQSATPGYRLFRNDGDQTFTRQENALVAGGTTGGAGTPLDSVHSFAVGDLNHDGFLDLYTGRATGFASPSEEPDLLFINSGNSNHFLTVQLTGTVSNPNAIGARVEIFGPWGVQTREVRAGEGYGIMNSLSAHFGLGAATTIDRVLVTWPSGFTTERTTVAADQFLAITESVAPGEFSTPVITSPTMVDGLASSNFVYRIRADNHPQGFSISNAPAGMSVSESGTVRWAPGAPGMFTFDVTATNPAGADTQTVSVDVQPNTLASAIEAEDYLVSSGAGAPWFRQTGFTHDLSDAAQAGSIGHGQSTSMEVTLCGPGDASFWWRVSSEQGFDLLSVHLDDDEVDDISGLSGWRQKSITIPAGVHTIRWTYSKDSSASLNQDTAWVDEFAFVSTDSDKDGLLDAWEDAHFENRDQKASDDPDGDGQDNAAEQAAGTDPNDPHSKLRITAVEALADGRVQLTWESVTGIDYVVQRSVDLTIWTDASSELPGSGAPIDFTTQAPTADQPILFWRVAVRPQ